MTTCNTTCAPAATALAVQLRAELDAASTCESTVTLSAATPPLVAAADTACPVTACSGWSTTAAIHTVYNFDLPVHAMVDALLFGTSMAPPPSTTSDGCPRSAVWSSIALPRIDLLASTADLYTWHAWFTLLSQYVTEALRVNGYNVQTAARALDQVQLDADWQRERLDARVDAQRAEDVLDAAAECPRACQAAADRAFSDQAAGERGGAGSGSHRGRDRDRDRYGARKRRRDDSDADDQGCAGGRARRKRARVFVPLDRRSKSGFDHLLADVTYERDCKRLEADLDEVDRRRRGVQRAQLLAKNVRDVLQHASGAFARLLALVDGFLREWEAADLAAAAYAGSATTCGTVGTACTTTAYTCPTITVRGPSLGRRMQFQQQFKAHLVDLRTFMSRQYVDGSIAMCENRCDGYGAYYPHFNYVVGDCPRPTAVTPGDAFWTDAAEQVSARGHRVVRAVVTKATDWVDGTVVDKANVQAYEQALRRAAAVMGVCTH